MKTFMRGWEYEAPALQHVMGLVLILAFIGTFVFKGGPVEDVLVAVFVLCCIVMIATNRRGWEHMTPFRWVLVTALLVTTLVDYLVDTPVTRTDGTRNSPSSKQFAEIQADLTAAPSDRAS